MEKSSYQAQENMSSYPMGLSPLQEFYIPVPYEPIKPKNPEIKEIHNRRVKRLRANEFCNCVHEALIYIIDDYSNNMTKQDKIEFKHSVKELLDKI